MHLIFDFDGTLVDSFRTILQKFNLLSDRFNYRKIDMQELDAIRDLSSKEFVKYLGIPLEQIPHTLLQLREYLQHEIISLPVFLNIPETLEKLSQLKISLGILTSNSKENVTKWLDHHGLSHFFDFVHIESSYLDKGRTLTEILDLYAINRTQAFYVGDETRDVDAAKAANISSIAVCWGFNSAKILAMHDPSYVINHPEHLFELCKTLQRKHLMAEAIL